MPSDGRGQRLSEALGVAKLTIPARGIGVTAIPLDVLRDDELDRHVLVKVGPAFVHAALLLLISH